MRRAQPATGRNTIHSQFLAQATRDLYQRLGDFERRRVKGSVILRWDLGEGDGIVVARKSTDDAKGGETIGAQLQTILRYCDTAGHRPRIVVAVLNHSGRTHFDERDDFTEVFEAFRRGEASWVVYRDMHRLARSMTWTALFVHYLREYGIGLHIADLHRQVDLHNHQELAQLWVLAMAAELAWATTGANTQTALSGQLRDAGKGWSKSGGFGFRRDDQMFIVVDEKRWPYVILIHELYASLRSIPKVRRVLETKHGLLLAPGTIHRILRDERFVTGVIKTKDPKSATGYRTDVVPIPRPVPQALREYNQMLLDAKRGKTAKTPEAQFVTRGLPVYHARCMDPDDPSRSADQLRSKLVRGGKYKFRHAAAGPNVGAGYRVPESCRGYSVEVGAIERAVIRGVRTMLLDDHELHRAISIGRANREPSEHGGLFTADDRTRLSREIRRLERHRDGLWQRHIDRIRTAARGRKDLLEEEIRRIDDELSAIRRQLRLDQQLRRRVPRATPIPDRLEAVLTAEPPDDPELRLRRWAIVHQLVSQVIVYDTDEGMTVEIYGPLVPDSDDPATWDPVEACGPGLGSGPARPAVPQPFRTDAKPERLVPAFRWRSLPDPARSGWLAYDRAMDALRRIAAKHPVGPIVGLSGIGAERWNAFAEPRRLPNGMRVCRFARQHGTTPQAMVREAVGARAAVIEGRVRVESREDVLCIMVAAIHDGFDFGPGWHRRAGIFGRDKPYAFQCRTLYGWAHRFADGDIRAMIADAQRLAATAD